MIKKIFSTIYKKVSCKFITNNLIPLVEEQRSFGNKNIENTIYIVRRPSTTAGLFSYVITTLGHIQKAAHMDYKIVVDMKNYINMYQQNRKDNAWEYFFEQPSMVSLKEAYRSKNVILSSEEIMNDRPNDTMNFFENKLERARWNKLYKHYIRVKPEIKEYVKQIKVQLFSENTQEKILGVLCRGTDYTVLKPKNHPVQPTADQVITKIKEIKQKHRVDKIFLVTEDENVLQQFENNFSSNELRYMQTKRFSTFEKDYLINIMNSDHTDVKQQGIDYLAQIILLSECDYFIGGRTSGSVGVALMREKFEYEYYWDLGRY